MFASLSRLSKLPSDCLVLPGHNYAMPAHSTIADEKETNHMMMQAMDQYKSSTQGISSQSVAAFLPLPDYLGVCRKLLKNHHEKDEEYVNAQQLESRF